MTTGDVVAIAVVAGSLSSVLEGLVVEAYRRLALAAVDDALAASDDRDKMLTARLVGEVVCPKVARAATIRLLVHWVVWAAVCVLVVLLRPSSRTALLCLVAALAAYLVVWTRLTLELVGTRRSVLALQRQRSA